MPIGTLNHTLRTLREIDLQKVRQAAEAPFRLFILGDGVDADWLALALSARPDRVGRHPWLVVGDAPGPTIPGLRDDRRLALLVTRGSEPSAAELAQGAVMTRAGVPLITVVRLTSAPAPVGAELPRSGESARALVAAPGGAADLSPLAAALLAATEDREGLRIALARELPVLRPAIVSNLIDEVARSNAVYAMTTGLAELAPGMSLALGPADILVLTKNQLMLAFKIALAAGRKGGNRELLGEVIGVIGSGMLLRQVARELVGLVPFIGLVPKVAVAYAGTQVIGQTAWAWADEGRRLGRTELRQRYRQALGAATAWARQALRRQAPPLSDRSAPAASVTAGPLAPS